MNGYRERNITIRSTCGNDFYFQDRRLSRDEITSLRYVTKMKNKWGSKVYLARPYDIDLNQIKIYHDIGFDKVHRCRIDDLYTVVKASRLVPMAKLFLIDEGTFRSVNLNNIYEFPPKLRYLQDMKPLCKNARISLGHPFPERVNKVDLEKYIPKEMSCKIRILEEKDEIIIVDIIDSEGRPLSAKLRNKLRDFPPKSNESRDDLDFGIKVEEISWFSSKPNSATTNRFSSPLPPVRLNSGAYEYFRQLLNEQRNNPNYSFMRQNILRARILMWSAPDSIYIIPGDEKYVRNHDTIHRTDTSARESDESDCYREIHYYQVGEKCLLRNEFAPDLGNWLRGVIVKRPDMIAANNNELGCIIYRVRSIDYGFSCFRSSRNLRPIDRTHSGFSRVGPWALRCRLFGLYDSDYPGIVEDDGFSRSCLNEMDRWLKERILDSSKHSSFYIIFRTPPTNLLYPKVQSRGETIYDISLFHRFEGSYGPKKNKNLFDHLNSYLIDKGAASDISKKSFQSSNIMLDEHFLNILVKHDKI